MTSLGRVYKRGRIWWIGFQSGRQEIRESSGSESRDDAKALLARRLGEIQTGMLIARQDRLTYEQLESDIIHDYEIRGLRSLRRLKGSLRNLRMFFGGMKAIAITTDKAREYMARRKERGAENATINREIAALKRMVRLAVESGRLGRVLAVDMLEEDNARQGFVTPEQFQAIVNALPEDLKDPIRFLYLSGWRVGEMQSLQWRDVDGDTIRLRPENSKSKQSRTLVCRAELLSILARARSARLLHAPWVFHRGGCQLHDFRTSWKAACHAAGRPATLVHDLRRSAVRNLVKAGVPERVAMAISGHKTRSIFDRYHIVSEQDLGEAMERLSERQERNNG